MGTLQDRWKNVSIARKLYAVVGVMACLIAGELLALQFSLGTLSAVRAFVGGEGSWSKAQKNAAFSLQRYALTRNEKDYADFLFYLQVPAGDRQARVELTRPHPDPARMLTGFVAGGIHPADVPSMVKLLRRFYWVSYLARAIEVWGKGDVLLEELRAAGAHYRDLVRSPSPDPFEVDRVLGQIRSLNERLTVIEDEFSSSLGAGSRWLEGIVISLLFMAVLIVESIGLTLTFLTTRSMSRGLAEVTAAADAIGSGNFLRPAVVTGRDEIGALAQSVNRMGGLLRTSYRDLERRVTERTTALDEAVRAREEFLSIASHELKTPLTALKLRIQLRRKKLERGEAPLHARLLEEVRNDERQMTRLTRLVDDMLDISRLTRGSFILTRETTDFAQLVRELVDRLRPSFREAGCIVHLATDDRAVGSLDPFRIEQVVTNLLTNVLKYGAGRPVHIDLRASGGFAILSVRDEGKGIAPSDRERIFRRFERAVPEEKVSGLGLGLYIAREIVLAHGGEIRVESEEGRGALFTVVLPLDRELRPEEIRTEEISTEIAAFDRPPERSPEAPHRNA